MNGSKSTTLTNGKSKSRANTIVFGLVISGIAALNMTDFVKLALVDLRGRLVSIGTADLVHESELTAASEVNLVTAISAVHEVDPQEGPLIEVASEDVVSVPVQPTFEIVRVEPTGDSVVAGLANPGDKIAIVSGETVLAQAETNRSGEWAVVLDKPMVPGGYSFGVRAEGLDGETRLSDQRITIAITENSNEMPIVMLNEPRGPSKLLQNSIAKQLPLVRTENFDAVDVGSTSSEIASETRVTYSSSGQLPESNDMEPMAKTAVAALDDFYERTASAEANDTVSQENEVVVERSVETESMVEDTRDTRMKPLEATVDVIENISQSAVELAAAETDIVETFANGADQSGGALVKDILTDHTLERAVSTIGVSSDRERDVNPTKAGADISSVLQAITTGIGTDDAQISFSGQENSAYARMEVAEASEVEARAQMAESAVALPPPATKPFIASDEATDHEAGAAGTTMIVAPPTEPSVTEFFVTVEAIEVEGDATLFILGSSVPGAKVRVYFDDEFVGEVSVAQTGRWLLDVQRVLPVGDYNVRVDQVDDINGSVLTRRIVPFERHLDLTNLKPMMQGRAGADKIAFDGHLSSGPATSTMNAVMPAPRAVTIRRGDSLWTISRRLYGKGVRYTTIYQANKEQIRDPNLIYPGQILILPSVGVAVNAERH